MTLDILDKLWDEIHARRFSSFTAKYAGLCPLCHVPIKKGDEILHFRSVKLNCHQMCFLDNYWRLKKDGIDYSNYTAWEEERGEWVKSALLVAQALNL